MWPLVTAQSKIEQAQQTQPLFVEQLKSFPQFCHIGQTHNPFKEMEFMSKERQQIMTDLSLISLFRNRATNTAGP